MILRELRARGWRNLASVVLQPGPGAHGSLRPEWARKDEYPGSGLHALCFRSFRTSSLSDLVAWGSQGATVEAEITVRAIDRGLKIQISQGHKVTLLDGKAVRRDSSALLGIGAVLFGPEDLRLPRAAAAERRRFLDRAVFGGYRPYFREVLTFERVLKSRNALLRRGPVDATLLASYDEKLAEAGARIVIRRRETCARSCRGWKRRFARFTARQPWACGTEVIHASRPWTVRERSSPPARTDYAASGG